MSHGRRGCTVVKIRSHMHWSTRVAYLCASLYPLGSLCDFIALVLLYQGVRAGGCLLSENKGQCNWPELCRCKCTAFPCGLIHSMSWTSASLFQTRWVYLRFLVRYITAIASGGQSFGNRLQLTQVMSFVMASFNISGDPC